MHLRLHGSVNDGWQRQGTLEGLIGSLGAVPLCDKAPLIC